MPPIRVCLSSRDPRFLRVTRFLLERRGFSTIEERDVRETPRTVVNECVDVAVIDATRSVADALDVVRAIDGAGVVLVADEGGARPLASVPLVRPWGDFAALAATIERVYARDRSVVRRPATSVAGRHVQSR